MTPPPADPVRELLDANRELCERAVHPLEIAAALEDSGLAVDGAARYRHADVFGLAEELYARVPRRPPAPNRCRTPRPRAARAPPRCTAPSSTCCRCCRPPRSADRPAPRWPCWPARARRR
ncbi:hypothetical protein [Kitasatospora cheerisanensis]|uniref:hypothetical protein n=1 Tax=Kitasatospora cheerisanensis TaxID=81942 RepID=UPI00055E1AC1|nr:hypothetical protein [Kitasatospora cheerisanensis]